jgi:hypothetical protein
MAANEVADFFFFFEQLKDFEQGGHCQFQSVIPSSDAGIQ